MFPRGPNGSIVLVFAAVLALLVPVQSAMGQFGTPSPTAFREKIVGQLLSSTGQPAPEAGDAIGAFYGSGAGTLCGKFTYTGSGTVARDFSILIYGDDTTTAAVKEGPSVGTKVTFKFFDSSTNTTLPVTVVTVTNGETFNYTFNGQRVIDLPGGIPIDLTPSRELNMRLGAASGDGNGDGNGTAANKYDINADGKVTIEDAHLVLRAVSGGNMDAPSSKSTSTGTQTSTSTTNSTSNTATQAATTAGSMDVNGDNRVDVNDAIEVLRHKGETK